MSSPPRDADFRTRLRAGLTEPLTEEPAAPSATVDVLDGSGRRATLFRPGDDGASLLVHVTPRNVDPCSPDVVDEARDRAESVGAAVVATCNETDLFLYDRAGGADAAEEDYRYLDIREDEPHEVAAALLDAVRHREEESRLPRQRERERVLGALRSFYSSLRPTLEELVRDAHDSEGRFREQFETWTRENGYGDRRADDRFARAARQYASLLVNRVLFSLGGGERTAEAPAVTAERPAFTSGVDLFEEFPHDERIDRAVAGLVETLQAWSVTGVDENLVGALHEEFIPPEEREGQGQYYTHPKLAETAVRWALPASEDDGGTDAVPRVLDPASGTGRFTVAAYQRLANRYPELEHDEIVDRLVHVDVNRVPLHLTSLALASQDPEAETGAIDARHGSFFDLVPDAPSDPGDAADALGTFDAVVGNPPYVRQENLSPDRTHFRRHLRRFGGDGETPYYDGSQRLSSKCDAYVYFLTHAAGFLRDGGRLGYVVPTKWMMTDYGRSVQRFLFDHFRLEAVVGFGARAFEDALVDTCLLLLERCEDPDRRAGTVTEFVRLTGSIQVEDVVDLVEADQELPDGDDVVAETRRDRRTVALRQSDLAAVESGKLAHYLTAPRDAIQLVDHPDLVRLDDLATVAYGNKTGANDFFFLGEEDLAEWPVDERFLTPAIKSIRDADSRAVTAETTDRYLLDVRDYVQEVETTTDRCDGRDPTERVKQALARDGHDALAAYVEHGERAGYHERSTCSARAVWFDLGGLRCPAILHPKFFDDRIVPLWNRDRLAPSNAVDCIVLDDGVDETAMLGVLNSTLHKLLLECWGRTEGGGALQLMTYEMESLPTVDPATIQGDRRETLVAAARRLLHGDEDAQADVDEVVLDVLDVDLTVEELRAMQSSITRRRIRGGDEVAVPVEHVEGVDEVGTRSFKSGR